MEKTSLCLKYHKIRKINKGCSMDYIEHFPIEQTYAFDVKHNDTYLANTLVNNACFISRCN